MPVCGAIIRVVIRSIYMVKKLYFPVVPLEAWAQLCNSPALVCSCCFWSLSSGWKWQVLSSPFGGVFGFPSFSHCTCFLSLSSGAVYMGPLAFCGRMLQIKVYFYSTFWKTNNHHRSASQSTTRHIKFRTEHNKQTGNKKHFYIVQSKPDEGQTSLIQK